MNIAQQYFADHPEAKDEVMRAFWAYHGPHHRLTEGAHNFPGIARSSVCVACGRSREMVRWDDLPPTCQAWKFIDIAGVIKNEEEKFLRLQVGSRELILKKYSDASKLTGEILSMLHHTHGIDPTTVEDVLELNLPAALHEDYLAAYEKHSETGTKGLKREVIKVQGI